MKYIKFLFLGIFFGIMMTKTEIVSWFRIQEMFRFQSFHMYGIIGSALALGMILTKWIKKRQIKDIKNNPITFVPKNKSITRYLIGGTIFGLGWALVGACPGPIFVLLGNGYMEMLWVILGALLGTFFYGVLKNKLPH